MLVRTAEEEREEDDNVLNEWTEWTGEASLDRQVLAQTDKEGVGGKIKERERGGAKKETD